MAKLELNVSFAKDKVSNPNYDATLCPASFQRHPWRAYRFLLPTATPACSAVRGTDWYHRESWAGTLFWFVVLCFQQRHDAVWRLSPSAGTMFLNFPGSEMWSKYLLFVNFLVCGVQSQQQKYADNSIGIFFKYQMFVLGFPPNLHFSMGGDFTHDYCTYIAFCPPSPHIWLYVSHC